jgi:glycopeptide antibiotics resistance protein
MHATTKRRLVYAILFCITIPIGLATRKMPDYFPSLISTYGGDILWAALFFFLLRAIFPHQSKYKLAAINYAFGLGIEISQLYHAPWIDDIRRTFAGKMLLGFGFMWSDVLCYAIGTLLAWLLATLLEKSPS